MKRQVALVSLMALAATLVATGPVPAQATFPGTNGRIAFEACNNVACQIFTSNPDGTALRQVTHHGDNYLADWSPDGTKLTYVSTASGDTAVWIANDDGSHARRLTPNDPNSDVVWPHFTPNGKTILFTNCLGEGCDGGIFSVDTDGSHLHEITPNSGTSYNNSVVSPDGTRMAYMRWHFGGITMAIYLSRRSGAGQHRVTPPKLEAWAPNWRPDGKRIVFATNIQRPNSAIFAIRIAGSGLQQLTNPVFPHSDWSPVYSPNGNRILFNSDRRYDDLCCGDLFVMNSDGTGRHRIRLPFQAYDAAWGTAPLLSGTSVGVTAGSSRMSPPWSLNNSSNDGMPSTWMQGSLR
jgi:Tol biopolymer transport system component